MLGIAIITGSTRGGALAAGDGGNANGHFSIVVTISQGSASIRNDTLAKAELAPPTRAPDDDKFQIPETTGGEK